MKHVTLTDIAARAGVSLSTVSRVLNGHPQVKEQTRQKVLACARELYFQPNRLLRTLTPGVKTIFTIFSSYTPQLSNNRYFAKFLGGIQEALDSSKWRNLWQLANEHGELDEHTRELISSREIAGVILVTRAFSPENIRLIGDIPTVLVNRVHEDHSCVYVDDRQAGSDVGRFLLDRRSHFWAIRRDRWRSRRGPWACRTRCAPRS